MWNTDKRTNQETEAIAGIQAIDAVELDNVTGGCACGCGQADCNCANGSCGNGAANGRQQFSWS